MDTSTNEYFIMHFTSQDLEKVLNNLNIILENKELIMSSSKETDYIEFGKDYFSDCVCHPTKFSFSAGLCDNANLWLLYEERFEDNGIVLYIENLDKNFESMSFMSYLGNKFSWERNKQKRTFVPVLSTIEGKDYSNDLWKNPQRWEYLEFCIEEVGHFLKTSTLKV